MGVKNTFAIASILIHLSGCATRAPHIPEYIASTTVEPASYFHKVALVTVLAPPKIDSVNVGYSHSQGAAAGAAWGMLQGLEMWSGGSCEGTICGAYVLLLPVFIAAGALIGGGVFARTGYSPDRLREAEAGARARLNSPDLQEQLLDHTRRYSNANIDLQLIRMPTVDPDNIVEKPNYAKSLGQGFDGVLEVALTHLSLDWSFLESYTPALKMEIRARLIAIKPDAVLSDEQYQFTSQASSLSEWTANGGAQLAAAIDQGLQTLAEDLVDETFLLYYPISLGPDHTDLSNRQQQPPRPGPVPTYVLQPVYPVLENCFFCEGPFSRGPHRAIGNLEFVEVDSTRPEFRWERFPGTHHDAQGISDVRYDMKIFDAGLPYNTKIILVPTLLAYKKYNISTPYHRVEKPLKQCQDYFWTVRARFKRFGRERVTEWAGAFNVGGWHEEPWNLRRGINEYKRPLPFFPGIHPDGPEWFYYPFRTPCDR